LLAKPLSNSASTEREGKNGIITGNVFLKAKNVLACSFFSEFAA
jgi:hypothetical protein